MNTILDFAHPSINLSKTKSDIRDDTIQCAYIGGTTVSIDSESAPLLRLGRKNKRQHVRRKQLQRTFENAKDIKSQEKEEESRLFMTRLISRCPSKEVSPLMSFTLNCSSSSCGCIRGHMSHGITLSFQDGNLHFHTQD